VPENEDGDKATVDDEIEIEDEDVPLGPADETVQLDVLPKTGEASQWPYYMAGMMAVALGLLIRYPMKKSK